MGAIATDYLVVGAGASGMAFTDELLTHSDAEVVLVDRRARPGGHWNDAYPFVRLHLPSAVYGVNSRPLGADALDEHGLYERASGAEVNDYYGRVLDEAFLPSGRVRFLGMHDYVSDGPEDHRVVSRLTGETRQITVRRKVVDGTYLETQVPATHTPSFSVEPGVPFVPVGDLVHVTAPYDGYVLLGAGKTAMDAALWLLDNAVAPDRIRWVKPQEAWLLDRSGWQPREQVSSIMEGISLELKALAEATSVQDLFGRLEECGRLLRIDTDVEPTVYRGGSISRQELEQLRQVRDVVRLGRVLTIGLDELTLEQGTVPTTTQTLHVDCSAPGLSSALPRRIFEARTITLQSVRSASPCFNAALIGYLETTGRDDGELNRLCPPNPYPHSASDWLSQVSGTQDSVRAWFAEPDLAAWLETSRLNLMRGVFDRPDEVRMQQALERYGNYVKPGMVRLRQLLRTVPDRADLSGRGSPAAPR